MAAHDLAASPLGSPAQTWRRRRTDYLLREFGDEVVVYDPESGDTHLLTAAHHQVLTLLKAGPLIAAVLLDRVRVPEGLGAGVEPQEWLRDILVALYALDLIEPTV